MTGRIEVHGADRLRRTLAAAGRDLADLTAANTDAGQIIARAAVNRAPARTGRLRRSIRADGTADEATISANTPYAGVIEYGWPAHHITARGYLRDALSSSERDVTGIYEHAVDEAIHQVKGI